MASERSDPSGGRAGPPPERAPSDVPPRDRILPQVTPREGWTNDWRPAIEELCAVVASRYDRANLRVLRHRLAPLLTRTVELAAFRKVAGKKPATVIRDQITILRSMPRDEAIAALRRPHPMLRDYLDQTSEAEDDDVDRSIDPDLASYQRAARRYALVMDRKNDILPQPSSGPENPWATVANLVAELLADVTGAEPKRTWDDDAQADDGWPLAFFRKFAALAVDPAEPPRLDRVWRDALDARRGKNNTAI